MNDGTTALVTVAIALACIAGWLTHIYVCFTTSAWGFLIAGAIFFPVAVFHGWGIWLGAW